VYPVQQLGHVPGERKGTVKLVWELASYAEFWVVFSLMLGAHIQAFFSYSVKSLSI